MWRPKGWRNPYDPVYGFNMDGNEMVTFIEKSNEKRLIFEAGADAMLEAIKKMPYCTHPVMLPNGNYYLIPEEED